MVIERVGYRRLYDAIDCSIPGHDEIHVAFPFGDIFQIEIYIGPTPRFGISTEKNDEYYAHRGVHNKRNISYHPDVTQSSYPRRFFTEIACFRDIKVSEALSGAFHRQDQKARDEVLRLAEKDGDEYRRIADLVSGTIGLKFHRQFIMELINENFVALRDASFAISVFSTPVELLDVVQMSIQGIEQIEQFSSLLANRNAENEVAKQWSEVILGWLMRAWSERDIISKFNALFTSLEMLLKGVKGEISKEKQDQAETIRELIITHGGEKQKELLTFFNSLVNNQNPSVMSRFETLAKQANMPTKKADIEAFRRFQEIRNGLVHRGKNNIQLAVALPKISDDELHAFEDIVERYINYVLFGNALIYQSHWRIKPLEPRYYR